jgi:hypothetical protein
VPLLYRVFLLYRLGVCLELSVIQTRIIRSFENVRGESQANDCKKAGLCNTQTVMLGRWSWCFVMERTLRNRRVTQTDLLLCFAVDFSVQGHVMEDTPRVIFDGTHEIVCCMRRFVRASPVWSEG